MTSTKLTIIYNDNFDLWPSISPILQNYLPLRNLHWKYNNRSFKSIHYLDVDIKPYTHISSDEKPHQLLSLLDMPYLNIFLVKCDDIDTYRNYIRSMIRRWHSSVLMKKSQEWLIVYVTFQSNLLSITKNTTPSKFLTIKTSVYDKIKADFNVPKKDRCVQLRLGDTDEIDIWQDLIVKMKEGILTSFNNRIAQYEEDIKKMDSQRTLPGWNYCTFFILKEGLAQSFEHMSLIEDSLIQYDELESSFYQTLRDNQLTWFGNAGGTHPNDDSESILDISKKPYRLFILQNTISFFDFRTYLFARQCHLLQRLGEYEEILRRGRNFITTMAATLRKYEETLVPWFIESWVWNSVYNIINITKNISNNKNISALRGELLFLARLQLDKIGIAFGHIPKDLLFSHKLSTIPENNKKIRLEESEHITNIKLIQIIDSKEEFLEEYHILNKHILKEFQHGNKPNAEKRILGDIAAFQQLSCSYLKHYKNAAEILKNIPELYSKNGWGKIECSIMETYASCTLETGDIEKYVKSCLSLLKSEKYLTQDKTIFYIKQIEKYGKALNNDILYPLESYFSAQLSTFINQFEDKDSYSLELVLDSKISMDISIDSISVKMHKETDNQEIYFIKKNLVVKYGKNIIYLLSNITSLGNHIIETIKIRIGKIYLLKNFLHSGKKFRIALFPRVGSLNVNIALPADILHNEQKISIEIDPGKNEIVSGHLDLKFADKNLKFDIFRTEAHLLNKEITKNNVFLFDAIDPGEILILVIPYFSDNEVSEIKLKTSVTYITKTTESYIFLSNFILPTILPLSINVQNYFKKYCIFSQFIISSNAISLRIINANLEDSKDFSIFPSKISNKTLILSSQTTSFIFKIIKKEKISNYQDLTFNIIYCTLEEEVFYIISNMLFNELQLNNLHRYYLYIIQILKKFQQTKINYDNYGLKQIIFSKDHINYWEEELVLVDINDRMEIIKILQKIMLNISINEKSLDCPLKKVRIPIKIPVIHVLHSVDFIIKSDTNINNDIYSISKITVGEPLHGEIRIQQILECETEKNLLENSEFFYEIYIDNNIWLFSGHKKARFFIKDDCLQIFPITLVPLKSGHLMLPTINITTITTSICFEVDYNYSMKNVLVLPSESSITFHLGSLDHSEPVFPKIFTDEPLKLKKKSFLNDDFLSSESSIISKAYSYSSLLSFKTLSLALFDEEEQKDLNSDDPLSPLSSNSVSYSPSEMYLTKAIFHSSFQMHALKSHTANILENKIFIFGGTNELKCLNNIFIFDLDTMYWHFPKVTGKPPMPCRNHTATNVGKNIVIFGGGDEKVYYNTVHVFDTEKYYWYTPITSTIKPLPRKGHTACFYNFSVYYFGGETDTKVLNDLWKLNCSDLDFPIWSKVETIGQKPSPRAYHSANIVGSNMIVIGGSNNTDVFGDVFILDIEKFLWIKVNIQLSFPRLAHDSTIIGPYLFISGGRDKQSYFSDISLLNIITMKWEKKKINSSILFKRADHTSTFNDFRLFFIGGTDGESLFSDIYFIELAND
ncbi:hypothetical protein PMAC_000182 [Pneumocystis sp. 'macacae']|nr:hypothetical protein PMAC_000182 [Pneumocystis sp. 'macacae']